MLRMVLMKRFYFQLTYDFQSTLLKKISTDGTMNGDTSQLVADASLFIDLKKKTIDLTRLNLTKAKYVYLYSYIINVLWSSTKTYRLYLHYIKHSKGKHLLSL